MPLIPKRGSGPARRRVSQDWFATLPRDKCQLFDSAVQRWESAHAMTSVALSDALTLRSRGEVVCAREQVVIASELLARLADDLVAACGHISRYGRKILDVPPVEPLKTSFFRGNTAKEAASWNSFIHVVLFGSRPRFLNKMRVLSGAIVNVNREFDQAVEELTAYSLPADEAWETVESLHYDMSTCLRELEVVFKCFLRALSGEAVSPFAEEVTSSPAPCRERSRARSVPAPALYQNSRY